MNVMSCMQRRLGHRGHRGSGAGRAGGVYPAGREVQERHPSSLLGRIGCVTESIAHWLPLPTLARSSARRPNHGGDRHRR